MAEPRTTSTPPVARFNVAALALFANFAAILAQSSVDKTQKSRQGKSGRPPIAKWLAAPVNAVNAMINTLVPTAVLSSYPSTLVKRRSIIIPPPAPINPQINPTAAPLTTDWKIRFPDA